MEALRLESELKTYTRAAVEVKPGRPLGRRTPGRQSRVWAEAVGRGRGGRGSLPAPAWLCRGLLCAGCELGLPGRTGRAQAGSRGRLGLAAVGLG